MAGLGPTAHRSTDTRACPGDRSRRVLDALQGLPRGAPGQLAVDFPAAPRVELIVLLPGVRTGILAPDSPGPATLPRPRGRAVSGSPVPALHFLPRAVNQR